MGFTQPPTSPSERWALTPPFHPYPCGRSVSVALSLKSPSPVVSRHSVPVVFGLSSHDERTQPFGHLICKSIHFSRAFWQAFTPVCVRFLLGAAIEFLGDFVDSLFFDARYITARYTQHGGYFQLRIRARMSNSVTQANDFVFPAR